MIFGAYRHAQVRSSELLGSRGAPAIVGLVWLVVALTLGIGFALRAAGAHLPARSQHWPAQPRWSPAGRC